MSLPFPHLPVSRLLSIEILLFKHWPQTSVISLLCEHYPPSGYAPAVSNDCHWNPQPPSLPQTYAMPAYSSFLNLNTDILALIAEFLVSPPYRAPKGTSFYPQRKPSELKALATTCRGIRNALLPWLFDTIIWPGKNKQSEPEITPADGRNFLIIKVRYPDLPRYALPHVCHLIVQSDQNFVVDDLIQCIPQMTRLSSCVFDCRLPLPHELIQVVLLSPTLERIQFLQTPLDFNVDRLSVYRRGCRELVLRPASGHHRINGGIPINSANLTPDLAMLLRNPSIPWMEEKISGAEMRRRGEARTTLYFLLPHLTPPLVRLEIDGALMPWILLPKLTWPRLETLILSGEHPIISNAKQFPSQPSSVQQSFPPQMQENTQPGPANQIPLITLLGGMRELKNLQFRWIHNPQRRFYIMEPKNRPHPGPPLPQGVPHTPLSADPTNPFNPGHSSPLMLPGSTPPGLLPTSSPSLATPPLARPGLSTAFPHLKSLTLSNPAEDDDCFANLPPSLEYLYLPIITRASVRPNGITPQALARILTAVKQCPLQLRGIQLTLHNHLPTPKLFGGLASCLPYLRTMEIGVMCYDGRRDAGEWAAYVEAIRNFPHLIGLNIAVPFPHNNTRVGCLGSDPEEYRFAHYLATHLPNLQYVALQSVAKLYDTDSPAFAYPPGNPSQAWVGEWNNWSRYDVYRRRVAVPGPGGGMGMGMGGGWIPMVDVRWNEAYTMTSPSSNA